MTIAVGSLVLVSTFFNHEDFLCVIISEGRPEFIGGLEGTYYYKVYCFKTKETFLCFNYEMTIIPTDQ